MIPILSCRGSRRWLCTTAILVLFPLASQAGDRYLTLDEVESLALTSDQRLNSARLEIEAANAMIDAAAQLEDPQARIAMQSLPVDSFKFDQEAMTQLLVGVKQRFPAGDTRQLRKRRATALAQQSSAELEEDQVKVLREVRLAWLDTYTAIRDAVLLEQKKNLLQQNMPLLESAYRAGRIRQLAISRMRVQIAKTEAAVVATRSNEMAQRRVLAQWVPAVDSRKWPESLPDKLQQQPENTFPNNTQLKMLKSRQRVLQQDIALAREKFKSNWAAEASYGVRETRSDLVTFGVTVSLPVARKYRQTPELQRRQKLLAAVEAETDYRHKDIVATLSSLQQEVTALSRQISIYRSDIIPELEQVKLLVDSDYSAGKALATDVIDADTELVKSRRTLLSLQVQRARIIIEIHFLQGEKSS